MQTIIYIAQYVYQYLCVSPTRLLETQEAIVSYVSFIPRACHSAWHIVLGAQFTAENPELRFWPHCLPAL